MFKYLPRPKFSFIQWHITERCNLRCKHCYQTSYNTPELGYEKLSEIFDEYMELIGHWGINGRIQITGGEPFIREEELFGLLERCHENRDKLTYGIMSNGFYITEEIARRLKNLKINFFQVSLEGEKAANDYIRGAGSYERILNGLKILVDEKVPASVSFTSSKANAHEFRNLVEVGKEAGANVVWSDRLVPWGVGSQMKNQMLEPLELKKHYENITQISKELKEHNEKTRVPTERTLYFLADCDCKSGPDKMHACDVVGTTGMTIMPDGIVYPCRRLPVKIGDLKEQSLFDIWYGNDFMWKLRDKNYYRNSKCGSCEFFDKCTTGSMCVTYGYCGTPFATDPHCWKAFKELPSPEDIKEDALKTELLAEKMLPDFWDNIYVPEVRNFLGEFIETVEGKYYFNSGKRMELAKSNNKIAANDNLYLNLEFGKADFNELLQDLERQNPNFTLISIKFKPNDILTETGVRVYQFLKSIKEKGINFRLEYPLPRDLFGNEYYAIARELKLPSSIKDSIGLFRINNDFVEFGNPVNKTGPKIKYIRDREQIYEYYDFLSSRMNKSKINIPLQIINVN